MSSARRFDVCLSYPHNKILRKLDKVPAQPYNKFISLIFQMPIISKRRRQTQDSLKEARNAKRSRTLSPTEKIFPLHRKEIESLSTATDQILTTLLSKAKQPLQPRFNKVHQLKPCNSICRNCKAKHWIEERVVESSKINPDFTMCCNKGKVRLPNPIAPPDELKNLLINQTAGQFLFLAGSSIMQGINMNTASQ
jgi:hypothetical protein